MVFTNVVNPRSHVIRRDEYNRTVVRRGASMGANSTIVCGVTIGQYAFVVAGSVTRDVPDYALFYGNPGRLRGWICACGIKLALGTGAGGEIGRCESCGKTYRRHGMLSRRRRKQN
jgi:UDP-2-acetamido-3-amino-2,3-dideoxy-glucuronate N-acetyltransferase